MTVRKNEIKSHSLGTESQIPPLRERIVIPGSME